MNFRFAKQPTNYLTMTRTFYIGDTRCKIGQGQLGGCHAFHDGFHFKENKWNKNALHAFIILFIKRQNDSSMLLDIQFLAKPPILHNSAHADCVRPLSIERIMSSRAYNAHEKWTRCFKLKFIIEEMWFGAIHASHYKLQNCVPNTENSVCLKCHFSKYIVIKIIERNTNVWLNQVSIEYETLNGSHNAMRCNTESHSIDWNLLSYNNVVRNRSSVAWMSAGMSGWLTIEILKMMDIARHFIAQRIQMNIRIEEFSANDDQVNT